MRAFAPLALFFMLLVTLSGLLDLLIITMHSGLAFISVVMWSVAAAAMLALKLTGRSLFELGWGWGPTKYHVIAFFLPIAYGALAYFAAGALGLATFLTPERINAFAHAGPFGALPLQQSIAAMFGLLLTVGVLQNMSTALGEEIGWRGFLVPRLTATMGFVIATLITGVIWGAWHVPMIIASGYNGGGDIRFELLSFGVGVVAMSGALSWLRLKSGSFWPCVTMHASHNLFIQNLFDPLSGRGTSSITMVGEFGVVFAAAVLLVSIPFWILGARLPRPA